MVSTRPWDHLNAMIVEKLPRREDGTAAGTKKDGRPRTGRKTLKGRGKGKEPPPSGGVRQWTSLVSIEGGTPAKERKPRGGRGAGASPGAKPTGSAPRRRTARPDPRVRSSKLSGGTSVGPDGRPRKCPLPDPDTCDPASLAEWADVERTLVGYAWIERGRYGKYRTRISLDGRKVELGCYDLASDAALAYDLGATRLGLVEGRGAELNFGGEGAGEGGRYAECRALEERAFGIEVDGTRAREAIDAKVAGAG